MWRILDTVKEKRRQTRGIIFQEEQTPTKKTPHLQGFIRFEKAVARNFVKETLGASHVWCEIAVDAEKAITYCRKHETRFGETYEEGDLQFEQGKSSRMTEAVRLIQEGSSVDDVGSEYPEQLVLHERGFRALRALHQKKHKALRTDLKVYLLYGATGVGKTFAVFKEHPDAYFVNPPSSGTVWYDGYDGESVLVLDEFSGWMSHAELLRLLDVYPLTVPYKGGFIRAVYTTVYITSNFHPGDWYPSFLGECSAPLARRITSTLHCGTGSSREYYTTIRS